MVVFNNGNYNPMDRGYNETPSENTVGTGIVRIKDLGQSVIDGSRGGRFQQSIQAAIRAGTSRLELNPQVEMGYGVETYGKEEREEIKALAKINEVDLHGVHAPVQVGDLTGKTQEGFSEQKRSENIDEIKKHIDFAADVLDGGHVVVHTGEYPRSISKATWNVKGEFEEYPGEAEEAVYHLVDPHTGRAIASVRENEEVFVPEMQYDEARGKETPVFDDTTGEFKIKKLTFNDFRQEKLKEDKEKFKDNYEVAKEFLKEIQEAEKMRSEGQAREYELVYQKAKYEQDHIKQQIDQLKAQNAPVEDIDRAKAALTSVERQMEYGREVALSARKQIEDLNRRMERVETMQDYGKRKAFDSLSELGLYAMKVEKDKHTKRPMFMAPEHIFPQMGYGSHPDEIVEFVKGARKVMIDKLTTQQVEDPMTKKMVSNPNFVRGLSKKEAENFAEKHIKATFDTQHMGMWYKHFKTDPGESEEHKIKRFNGWYMDQVKKMEKSGVIGNVHIVDGFGRGHSHVVAGQGIFPIVEAVEYLKKKGFSGHMISEAYENLDRISTGTWDAFGSPIYHAVGGPSAPRFSDVQSSYFGKSNPPPYVFGAYAPSEDWTLWSGVPFE
ncbi:hypothetical protein ACFL96_19835 [Thermoproteota archaeon]